MLGDRPFMNPLSMIYILGIKVSGKWAYYLSEDKHGIIVLEVECPRSSIKQTQIEPLTPGLRGNKL